MSVNTDAYHRDQHYLDIVPHFDAAVETGYDRGAQVTYHFTAGRQLCGWKSRPGGTPQQLVVHA